MAPPRESLVCAVRAVVSEACMEGRGQLGAIDEALRRVREEAIQIALGRGRPLPCKLHFVLEVENLTRLDPEARR